MKRSFLSASILNSFASRLPSDSALSLDLLVLVPLIIGGGVEAIRVFDETLRAHIQLLHHWIRVVPFSIVHHCRCPTTCCSKTYTGNNTNI
mmetsp:Transcript_3838/g.5706  ORF Transcript_3838/g.5706 Transcript_3838/m.5706 type:complete len:91 (+) Transcript_3838:1453-1725(+)